MDPKFEPEMLVRTKQFLLMLSLTSVPLIAIAQTQEERAQLANLNQMGLSAYNAGNWETALSIFEQAYKLTRAAWPEEDLQTLEVITNLALLYQEAGRHAEAELFFSRSLSASERVLGSEHPDTLISMNNLAFLYYETRRRTWIGERGHP